MRVGPFELETVLGRGGMGVVYQARHVRQDTVAAVKFDLHPPDPQWDEVFLNEVRLMAGLDHPCCVVVYDTGRVAEHEVDGLDPSIRPGSSWLAMELAGGGSLKEHMPTRWDEALHAMKGLLEGLAHAHSRGVVHRDIKPANLLLHPIEGMTRTDLLRYRVILSDFGIGHAAEKPTWMDEQSVGTPQYMSPEQIEAEWRDQGPWTDLYQAGVMCWRLVTGHYPFSAKTAVALYRAHLFQEPERFEPAFAVPAGVEAWCRGLLAKSWRDRPDSASLALEALMALGSPVSPGDGRALAALRGDDLETSGLDTADTASTQVTGGPARADASLRGTVLQGAGLGLWGLRKLPLIGRTRECHALSHALRLVELHQSPRFCAISGPAGVGKTRLAEWLAESSVEQGRARTWRAIHTEGNSADHDGIRGMLRRELRVAGLEAHQVRHRLEGWFADRDLVAVLERWLADGATAVPSMRERAGAMVQVFQRLSRDRPLVVWLEDVHESEDTLRFTRFALDATDVGPVLFVATLRDERLAEMDDVRSIVDELVQRRDSRTVRLAALGDVEHQELVRRLLGLEPALAIQIEKKTAGNPRFAVQLVNDWVERGILVPGPDGLTIRQGASTEVPDDVVGVWRNRLAQLLPSLDHGQTAALEIASVFGRSVDQNLWTAACMSVGVEPGGLLAALLRRGLAFQHEGGSEWAFGHELFRQVVRQRAQAGRRLARWSSVAADAMLAARRTGETVAELLLEAGRTDEAFEPLRMAVNFQLDSGDLRSEAPIDRLESVLEEVNAPPTDARWSHATMLRAWFCRIAGETARSERLVAKALRLAQASGDRTAIGWAYREAGMTAMRMGDTEIALEDFEQAALLLEKEGRPESAALCLVRIADIWLGQGALDDAEVLYERTIGAFERPEAWEFAYEPHIGLARVAAHRGDSEQAFEHLADARRCVQRAGARNDRMRLETFEGDLRRKSGQMAEAARCYQNVVAQASALNLGHREMFARLNLAILMVTIRDFARASEELTRIEHHIEQSEGDEMLVGFTNIVKLPVLAFEEREPELAAGIEAAFHFTEATGTCEPDVALVCEHAAELTLRADLRASLLRLAAMHRPQHG